MTHAGKLYNLLALRIARRLDEEGTDFAAVRLLSRIGDPVAEPWAADVSTTADGGRARSAVEAELDRLDALTEESIRGEVDTFRPAANPRAPEGADRTGGGSALRTYRLATGHIPS